MKRHRVAALIGLAAADLGSTLYGFSLGASEAMPVGAVVWAGAGVLGLIALKFVSVAGVLAIIRMTHPYHRPFAWAFALFLMTLPVGWNIGTLIALATL